MADTEKPPTPNPEPAPGAPKPEPASEQFLRNLEAEQATRRGMAAARDWLKDIVLLAPVETVSETIEGQSLEFRCPKTAKWLAALPHLQQAYQAARVASPDGDPWQVLALALMSWEAPNIMAAWGESVCKILDVFLGKDLGYVAENFRPDSIVRMVRNFIRVIPVREMRDFFGQSVGALLGQRQAATAKPKE